MDCTPPEQVILRLELHLNTGGISDDRAGRSLTRALQDRGPFRRFKDKLHQQYPNLLPAWHAFSEARALRRAVQWLAEEELINQEAADRYQTGHPEPDLP